jgi:orotate phosphoribosyltransferase-like protein
MAEKDQAKNRRELADKALALRQTGLTFADIAAALSVSESKASRLYRRALERLEHQTSSSVDVLTATEADNLRRIGRMIHGRLRDDTPTPEFFAGIKLLLGVSAQRAKLHGLNAEPAPFKPKPAIDTSQPGGPITDQQRVKRILELLGGTKPAE